MKSKIYEAIAEINNLYTNKPIENKVFIKKMVYNEVENKVLLEINPLGSDEDKNRQINREIIKKLKIDLKIFGVKIVNAVNPGSKDTKTSISDNTEVILVVSGKGGVGKSNVTAELARKFTKNGKKVGIIDADIYGYSIPKIFDLYGVPEVKNKKIVPLKTPENIEIISAQYFIEDNKNEAIVWRGAMTIKLLKNFLQQVSFSEDLDYIFVDMPPGTGDIMLSIGQYLEDLKFILVTTPQKDAVHVSTRAFSLCKQLGFLDLGIIENMSYIEIDEKKHYLYGESQLDILAKSLKTKGLGTIRFLYNNKEDVEQDYQNITDKIRRGK